MQESGKKKPVLEAWVLLLDFSLLYTVRELLAEGPISLQLREDRYSTRQASTAVYGKDSHLRREVQPRASSCCSITCSRNYYSFSMRSPPLV